MKSLILVFCACAWGSAAETPRIAGDWLGAVSAGGVELRLALHLKQSGDGKWTGSFDSIDQGANGIPIEQISVEGGKLSWKSPAIHGSYEGTFDGAHDAISGIWSQGGGSAPLDFKRMTEPLAINRPQEPKPPFPYLAEEVAYDNPAAAGVRLAGTFTKPKGDGPFPAVLLITGSGPQNRNEEIMGHKPFLLIADYLTRRGISVLRVDDRGVGKSTGSFGAATTEDFATDTMAGVRYLLGRGDVDKKHIGLIGHSEGGVIAPMVAAKMPEIAFIVMLAGSGVAGDQIIPEQVYQGDIAAGSTPAAAGESRDFERKMVAIVRDENDPAAREKKILALAEGLPELQASLKSQMAALNSSWYRYFLAYDPAPALARVKCPVLALSGSKDTQVVPEQNVPAIRAALAKGGNKDATVEVLPGLNHLFQDCKTGAVLEYAKIEETMSPKALELMATWIQKHVG